MRCALNAILNAPPSANEQAIDIRRRFLMQQETKLVWSNLGLGSIIHSFQCYACSWLHLSHARKCMIERRSTWIHLLGNQLYSLISWPSPMVGGLRVLGALGGIPSELSWYFLCWPAVHLPPSHESLRLVDELSEHGGCASHSWLCERRESASSSRSVYSN